MNWLKRFFRTEVAPAHEPEPADVDAWLRAGYDCQTRGDEAGAERLYRKILEHDPTYADAYYFLGRIALSDRREEEAIALFQKAVELRPREAAFLWSLGDALNDAKRFAEAVEVLGAGVALQRESTAMRNNYAVALIELGRREEARIELERLRTQLPDAAQVHFNLGGIYREYGRVDDASAAYRRALQLTPDHAPTWSNLLLNMNYSLKHDAREIFAEHRRFGERFARGYAPPQADAAWPRRLRLGYVSPDFRAHSVAYFIEPVLASHDRARFEVFCYHTYRSKDRVTERLRAFVEHWLDCEDFSDAELADRVRADRIDILVDLAGHTADNRMQMFAMKPALVQATYLGYPNTAGLGAMDHHITDAQADPPGDSDRLYVERQARLPSSYFCYRPPPEYPEVGPLPSKALGAVTFGCFNHLPKLCGAFIDAAARILSAVPGSRLLLKSRPLSIQAVAESLRARLERAGIDRARIELRGWEPGVKDHLAIYGSVDIALDSFPYNGATTTCEALWMGVPVVTLAGDRHCGRMGSSLLNAVGLGEYVARDAGEYVATCVRLAEDTARLEESRSGLRDRMRRSPLMDEAGFTRALERCFIEMWENRSRSGAVPRPMGEESAIELLEQARRSRGAGRRAEAEAACRKILLNRPDHPEALTLLWDLAFDAGTPSASIDGLVAAIAVNGNVAGIHHMLGCALQAQGKTGDAIASFRRALELGPTLAKTHNNLGCALEAAGQLDEAVESYRRAIRLDPKLAHARFNLGNVCKQLGDAKQAIRYIERALAIEPGHADWRGNLGYLRYNQLQLDEAVLDFRAALEIDPADDRAYSGLGAAMWAIGRVEDATAAFRKALDLNPRRLDVESWLLLLLHYREVKDVQAVFEHHRSWANRHARGLTWMRTHPSGARGSRRRLNVGYVSPDFRRHPVAYFIEPVLAAHDRRDLNVFCYATAGGEDEITLRLRDFCEHWRDISIVSDENAADRIRADGIDILVDLAGHTAGSRPLLFARKAAPVQVTWLGYPNTTGLDAMDYRLTDAVADPEGQSERFHTEKLIRLPHGFLCYAPPPESPEVGDPPQREDGRITFASFNNLAKVTPRMIALWSELLRRLPDARMILKTYGLTAKSARRELRERFLAHGIGEEQLDLRPSDESFAQHLALYREVDVALDVFPYNGATTTCEALWMGVPVVTLAGSTHVSRVGASILNSVGLSELVASTPEQYLELALQLALDVDKQGALRAGKRERMRSSPLLDAPRFTRALEAAYRDMSARANGPNARS